MTKDISRLLDEWAYDPGQVSARWIVDSEGERKVQLRVDMGVLEMTVAGRPDGTRPHGHDSLFAYYREQEKQLDENGGVLHLDTEACNVLQQEAMQFYYRYLAFYALRHLDGVIEDTRHNLELLELVSRCATNDELIWSFVQYFPYVRMMYARAVCEQLMDRDDYAKASVKITRAIEEIRMFFIEHGDEEALEDSEEVEILESLRERIEKARPLTKEETLRSALDLAIRREEYERAAELRDALKTIGAGTEG